MPTMPMSRKHARGRRTWSLTEVATRKIKPAILGSRQSMCCRKTGVSIPKLSTHEREPMKQPAQKKYLQVVPGGSVRLVTTASLEGVRPQFSLGLEGRNAMRGSTAQVPALVRVWLAQPGCFWWTLWNSVLILEGPGRHLEKM